MLFTYDEYEREINEVAKNNASLIFTPQFIPFYPGISKKFDLSNSETLILGFIYFFLSSSIKKRFYFTNEQLGELFNLSSDRISKLIANLREKELISVGYKTRSDGGQTRFVNNVYNLASSLKTTKPLVKNNDTPSQKQLPNKNIKREYINKKPDSKIITIQLILGLRDDDIPFLEGLVGKYPNLDCVEEAEKMMAWLKDHPQKHNSKPRLRYMNWLKKAVAFSTPVLPAAEWDDQKEKERQEYENKFYQENGYYPSR